MLWSGFGLFLYNTRRHGSPGPPTEALQLRVDDFHPHTHNYVAHNILLSLEIVLILPFFRKRGRVVRKQSPDLYMCIDTCLFHGGGDYDPLDATVEIRLQLLLGQELPLTIHGEERGHTEREEAERRRVETWLFAKEEAA